MTDEFDRLLWTYRAMFKQTDVGGGSIVINITPRERILLLMGLIGTNDYAANRTLTIRLNDEDDNSLGTLAYSAAVDNTPHAFPVWDHSVHIADDGPILGNKLVVGGGEYIKIIMAGLVQNEEVTLAVRSLVNTSKPAITTTGSGGTVTTTVTYDKVI